ncbi:MAG: 4Fe-4S binding protein [Deltaproteobacteria bacterium]|nr:4Fe-4S binding protein [Deltaproteobacteria bacterium]
MSTPEEAGSPRLTVSRCLRARFHESRCARCLDECVHGAIHLDGVVRIDAERCRGCLACTAACPSGALEVAHDFRRIVDRCPPTDALVLGCARHPIDSGIHVPCLGMLTEEHLVYLLASCPEPISLVTASCSECENASAVERMKNRLSRLERLTLLPIADRVRFVTVRPEPADRRYDRRSFFTTVTNRVVSQVAGRIASGSVSDPDRPGTDVDYSTKRIPQRCRLLAAALLRETPDQARVIGNVLRFRMKLSTSCDGCFGCVAVCPTGALQSSSQGPRFNEVACTGCELCVEFCLEGAIRIHPKSEAAGGLGRE